MQRVSFHPFALRAFLAASSVLAAGTAPAADPPAAAPVHDPQARRQLDEIARAYKALGAYADQGEFAMSMIINGTTESQTLPLHLTFARPNKLNLDAGVVRIVSDGTTLTTAVAPLKQYTAAAAPKTVDMDTLAQGPAGSVLFGGPVSAPMIILTGLLLADDAPKAILSLGGTLKVEPDQKVGDATCPALLLDQPEGPDVRLVIDPATKLLKSIDLVVDAKEIARRAPKELKVEIGRIGWTAGEVSTKAPDAQAFAYEPPKGFTKVEALARSGGWGEGAKYPVNDLVGKPAPDFTLTVLDGAGKTRTIAKADLAGKVVVIDFWATWCGPCLKVLPELQRMIEAYAKDDKDVVVVALSQDDRPSDPTEVRKLVETTLDKQKIDLTSTEVGLVGIDPSHAAGDVFQVNAYPTIVLIDAKGVVQAAHVGLTTREVLSQGIDTLLDGKPLVGTPKPDEAATAFSP
ncbi:MAG TPA: redoxin family protein [Isosphaeraceae bacterium]|nr:redoxin family protein [Isosphaeraceae bacterium]